MCVVTAFLHEQVGEDTYVEAAGPDVSVDRKTGICTFEKAVYGFK